MFLQKLLGRLPKSPCSTRTNRRARSTHCHRHALRFEPLESRQLLAGIFFDSGVVTIAGGAGNDIGTFESVNATSFRATLNGFPDQSFLSATVSKVTFIGFDGNDQFTNDTAVESLILGNSGNDILTGGSGIDVINGGAGHDRISGEAGPDRLIGSGGNDEIHGGTGHDKIFGGSGVNELNGNSGDDLIFGGDDVDTIAGGEGADQIFSLGGDDIVSLGNGGTPGATDSTKADLVLAGSGNDTLRGGSGLNIFYGGDGDDVFQGGNGENRMHGQNGDDQLNGGSSADFLAGQLGDDTINAGSGNDYIIPGFGNDTVDAGSGNDFVAFNFRYNRYQITINMSTLTVYDSQNADGRDAVTATENFRFSDGDRAAEPSAAQRVSIQPIIVSNTNGSNTAEFFGNATQEAAIKVEIDEIFSQANVDIGWRNPQFYRNTFANVGNQSSRPQSDLGRVVSQGDAAGVGSSNRLVIDMYFVEVAAGFSNTSENTANGLAYVDDNGITIHIGDNLVGFESGRAVVARVAAHEIAHNLGLDHVSASSNLMADGTNLTTSQINAILDSAFSMPL